MLKIIDAINVYLLMAFGLLLGISRAGFNITLAALFLAVIIRFAVKPFPLPLDGGIKKGLLLLFSVFSISAVFSSHLSVSLKSLSMLVVAVTPAIIAARAAKERQVLERTVWIMAVSFITGSGVAVWQGLHGMARAKSFVGIMDFAGFIGLTFPIFMVYAWEAEKAWQRCLTGAAAIAVAVGLVFNGTRSIWITVMLSIVLYLLLNGSRNKKMLTVTLLLCLTALFIGLNNDYVTERVKSIGNVTTNVSNLERFGLWRYAWSIYTEHPLLGVGYGALPHPVGNASDPEIMKKDWAIARGDHVHNNVLQILAENGLIGLIGYAACFTSILWSLWRRKKEVYCRKWAVIGILSTVDFIVHGMFDYTLVPSTVLYTYWFVIGLTQASFQSGQKEEG